MPRGRGRQHKHPIGVEVTLGGVRLAQAVTGESGHELVAAAQADVCDGLGPGDAGWEEALGEAIAAALRQAKFSGKACVSAMPATQLQHKNVRLPKLPPAELAGAVQWESRERINLGEPAAVEFYDAGEVRQGDDIRHEVILLAAKQASVESHVASLVRAGLEPVAIDATGAALARACCDTRRDSGTADETSLIIHANERSLEIVIAQGQRVFFNKLIDCGPAGLGGAAIDDLTNEVALCLRYVSVTFRGQRPQRMILAGRFHEALRLALTASVGVPVEDAASFAHLSPGRAELSDGLGRWLITAGLSLRHDDAQTKRGAA